MPEAVFVFFSVVMRFRYIWFIELAYQIYSMRKLLLFTSVRKPVIMHIWFIEPVYLISL